MYGQDRNQIRQVYIDTWQKHRSGQTLDPMQKMIADIIQMHPEYHAELQAENTLVKDYTPEMGQSNPFLHMGLHIAIQEQLSTDQPKGVRSMYQQLLLKHQDNHQVEHMIMECLAQMIWEAQNKGQAPDEQAYLENLRSLL